MTDTQPTVPITDDDLWTRMEDSPEFRNLRYRFVRFVVPVTVAFLGWFFLYFGLNAWAPGLLARKVVGNVTLVLVLALGQFVSTFLITVWYVHYATRQLDPLADDIRDRLEGAGS